MKKKVGMKCIVGLMILFCLMITTVTNAKWIYSEKAKNYLWIDDLSNSIIINNYFWAEDGDYRKLYHAGQFGFIDVNKQIDSIYSTNEKGEVMQNGIVLTLPKQTQTQVINPIPQATEAQNTEQSQVIQSTMTGSGRSMNNYIKSKDNVDILEEKTINGEKKKNVIYFKKNGASITLDTKKYNKITLTLERDRINKDVDYQLSFVVNGIEEDSVSMNYDQLEQSYEFEYKLNDKVEIIMTNDSDSQYSFKGLYVTQGRMSKYKESKEDED